VSWVIIYTWLYYTHHNKGLAFLVVLLPTTIPDRTVEILVTLIPMIYIGVDESYNQDSHHLLLIHK